MNTQVPRLAGSLVWPETAVLLLQQLFQWSQAWKMRLEMASCTGKGISVLPAELASLVQSSGSEFLQVLSFLEVWKTSC